MLKQSSDSALSWFVVVSRSLKRLSRTDPLVIGVHRLEESPLYYLVQVFGLSSVVFEHTVDGWNVLEERPLESRTTQRRPIRDLLEDYLQPND